MTSINPSPLKAPPHVHALLERLHTLSRDQEAALSKTGKVFSSTVIRDLEDAQDASAPAKSVQSEFDAIMQDKFIALDQDKCLFTYSLIQAMGATNVIEAGTSFGVSTIYLALAVGEASTAKGVKGRVIATEYEASKAAKAREYWAECGEGVESVVELREGDLLETLKKDVGTVDLLLLDIWTPMALPTLKTVLPSLRRGAVVLADNTIIGAEGYKDLLGFLRDEKNGFRNMTLPFTNGFEMSVYLPDN